MSGYLLMNADLTDPAGYGEYKTAAAKVVADFGGRFLVRGGAMAPVEGDWHPRCVLIEFPSYDDALAFYRSDAYQGRARHPAPLRGVHGAHDAGPVRGVRQGR